jgi:hypothetical protein
MTPQSAVLPDDSDMRLGRERPLRNGRGTVIGGGRGGRSRPDVSSLRPTAALTVIRAAQSAARCDHTEPADCEGHRRIGRAQRLSGLRRPRARQQYAERGNTAPVSVFPPLCSLFRLEVAQPWMQIESLRRPSEL